jgi:uncharacterized protein YbjT (DUF2867 family)
MLFCHFQNDAHAIAESSAPLQNRRHRKQAHLTETGMFAITGITGQVGGVVARTLLREGKDVRAVVRSADKGAAWAQQGCDVVLADMNDASALNRAFAGTEGVFVLLPPHFDPAPGYPEAHRIIKAVHEALDTARPGRVVCLSTIGAQAPQPNLLNQLQNLEQRLGTLPIPIAFLRAGWFMENAAWDIQPARTTGVIPSFLLPLDKPVPMVSTADVGRVAADLLQETWGARRIVELEGPRRIRPNDIAATFSRLLGREVRMQAVPRVTWEQLFRSQGMKNPTPRMQMLDGFNAGWIEFENGEMGSQKGTTTLEVALKALLAPTLRHAT